MNSTFWHVDIEKSSPQCCTYQINNSLIMVNEGPKSASNFAAQIAAFKDSQADNDSFFVMNADRVGEQLDTWHRHLPRVQPFYSLGCNPNPLLLRWLALHPALVGFHCASAKELPTALDFLPPDRLCCLNPCWTNFALQQTAAQGVQLVSFESERDLHRILGNHPDAELLLQICVNLDSEDPHALFGCQPEKAPALLQLAAELGLRCCGVSFTVGVDCAHRRPQAMYAQAIEWAVQLFGIGAAIGHQMRVLNIGNVWSEAEHFPELCVHINQQLALHGFDDCGAGNGKSSLRVMATPGRFLAASVFSLITNVVDKRPVDASAVTNNDFDSGTQAFLYQINEGYYSAFGCRIMANCEPQCTPLFDDNNDANTFSSQQQQENEMERVYGTVIGPMGLEDPETDTIQPMCHFRQLNIGDWLIWADMGAYTFGNDASLDDDGLEDSPSGSPAIFCFASRRNWDRVSQRLFGHSDSENQDEDQMMMRRRTSEMDIDFEDGETAQMKEREMAESEGEEEEEDDNDNFWMFGWPLHCE